MSAPPADPFAAPRSFRTGVLEAARAGAFAAGGSVVALAGAVSLGAYYVSITMDLTLDLGPSPRLLGPWLAPVLGWSAHRLPLGLWLAGTAVSAVLAVAFGYPGAARGALGVLRRAGGVAVFGTSLGAAVLWVAAKLELPAPPLQDDVAVWVLLAAGVALLTPALTARPARHVERAVPEILAADGPGRPSRGPEIQGAGGALGLAAAGPPVSAEESERAAAAVEVRVLWGGDLLRVVHLDPPRSFYVGDEACDLAIDGEALGVRRFPAVLAGPGGVSVVAPRGATGTIVAASGARGSIGRAVEEGLGEALAGAVSGTRIPLAPGGRVMLALPGPVAGAAYRTAGGEARPPGGAPVVLEIALVRAGRVVGRGRWLEGSGRVVASTALAAGLAWACLALTAPRLLIPDEQEAEAEAAFVKAYAAIAAREIDELPEPVESREPLGASGLGYVSILGPPDNPIDWGADGCGPTPGDPFGVDPFTGRCGSRYGERFDVITPFGLRFSGVPELPDLLWRDRRDLFWTGASAADDRPSTAKVRLGTPIVKGRLAPEVVQRVLRGNRARVRACFEQGRRTEQGLTLIVGLRLSIGADGSLVRVENEPQLYDRQGVVSCVLRALEGLSFPRPAAGTVTVTETITLGP